MRMRMRLRAAEEPRMPLLSLVVAAGDIAVDMAEDSPQQQLETAKATSSSQRIYIQISNQHPHHHLTTTTSS